MNALHPPRPVVIALVMMTGALFAWLAVHGVSWGHLAIFYHTHALHVALGNIFYHT